MKKLSEHYTTTKYCWCDKCYEIFENDLQWMGQMGHPPCPLCKWGSIMMFHETLEEVKGQIAEYREMMRDVNKPSDG